MSELNVRILHKYDTYAEWMSSTLKLEAGELAICEIPQQTDGEGAAISGQVLYDTANNNHLMQTPPAIGIKVGDGEKVFKDLPWIQAVAGDVHAWAKKSSLQFTDLDDTFKEGLSTYIAGEIQDTDTTYEFKYEKGILKVYWKNKANKAFTYDEAHTAFSLDLTTKMDKVDGAVKGNLAEFGDGGQVVDSGKSLTNYYTKDETVDKTTFTTLEQSVTHMNTKLGTVESDVTNLKSQITGLSGAMHFKGELTLVEGQKIEDITTTTEYTTGDVVLLNITEEGVVKSTGKEYVWVTESSSTEEIEGVQVTTNKGEFIELGDVTAEGQRIAALEKTVNDEAKGVAASAQRITNLENVMLSGVTVGEGEDRVVATVTDHVAEITQVPTSVLTNGLETLILKCGDSKA